ncbi:MAG: hypothetical protein KBF21_13870 [Thermoanaerobaculia bacterium]|nr:hypothetical protein [Thermoanaerobaculia bacterium]
MPSKPPAPPIKSFHDVLKAAGQRPKPGSGSGPGYATAFANAMAVLIANAFRGRFPGIKPDPSGKGVESPSRALRGLKKLDVNFSTPQAGLCLGISLKSVHLPDKNPKHRYHHNRKRNDEELRVEAAGYHQRQPYSVLVAVVVLPFEACDDADSRPSSFGMWVQYLWPLARRSDPHDDVDRFEHVFVALYDEKNGKLAFFDVTEPPPKKGRPKKTLTLEGFVERVAATYEARNSLDFAWESGEHDPGAEEDDE